MPSSQQYPAGVPGAPPGGATTPSSAAKSTDLTTATRSMRRQRRGKGRRTSAGGGAWASGAALRAAVEARVRGASGGAGARRGALRAALQLAGAPLAARPEPCRGTAREWAAHRQDDLGCSGKPHYAFRACEAQLLPPRRRPAGRRRPRAPMACSGTVPPAAPAESWQMAPLADEKLSWTGARSAHVVHQHSVT